MATTTNSTFFAKILVRLSPSTEIKRMISAMNSNPTVEEVAEVEAWLLAKNLLREEALV